MTDDGPVTVAGPDPPAGCLRSVAALVALVALAPFALLIRTIGTRTRGTELRLERASGEVAGEHGDLLTRIDTTADVPMASVDAFRRRLTDVVVRVAEALRGRDDVYHLVYRDPAASETIVVPVGPLLQELGERFHLVLTEAGMSGRTAVWLALPGGRRIVELVDPLSYDPETAGEPDDLLGRGSVRWGMATAFRPCGPAVLFRIVLFVAREKADEVEAVLDRLSG